MNKRQLDIIEKLSSAYRKFNISELADECKVSERTIRKDLDKINELLEENKIGRLVLKSGKIIKPNEFNSILNRISKDDFYSYKLSKPERIDVIIQMLINSVGYVTLACIADYLCVSRVTVINDLDEIKEKMLEWDLQVISRHNKGLRVEGKEEKKRELLLAMQSNLNVFVVNNVIQTDTRSLPYTKGMIEKIVNEQEHMHRSFLSDESFGVIIKYLSIMIMRNIHGYSINDSPEKNLENSQMAQDILKYITQYCRINVNVPELIYFSRFLKSQKFSKGQSTNLDTVKIQILTRQLIDAVSEDLGVNLNTDYDFFENLSNHLESTLAAEEVVYDNQIVDEIRNKYKDVFESVNNKVTLIENYINRKLTDIEVDYISVHVCAAIERRKNNEVSFKIVVACHAGIGTSKLLLENLKEYFNFLIIDIVSVHDTKYIDDNIADLVISTVPIDECKIDNIVVSPMLTDEDCIRVGNKIDSLRKRNNLPIRSDENTVTVNGVLENISSVLYEEIPGYAPDLIVKIQKNLRSYFKESLQENSDIFSPELHHLLPYTHIELDVECKDWQEAIRKSAALLLEKGYIEPRYIDEMINNIEEFGPYMIISKGFALPHSKVEFGSLKLGMNLIRLKEPVCFGNDTANPVEYVCCLSAVDGKTHLRAFFNLVNILKKTSFKEELHKCSSSREAAELIVKYEYQL